VGGRGCCLPQEVGRSTVRVVVALALLVAAQAFCSRRAAILPLIALQPNGKRNLWAVCDDEDDDDDDDLQCRVNKRTRSLCISNGVCLCVFVRLFVCMCVLGARMAHLRVISAAVALLQSGCERAARCSLHRREQTQRGREVEANAERLPLK